MDLHRSLWTGLGKGKGRCLLYVWGYYRIVGGPKVDGWRLQSDQVLRGMEKLCSTFYGYDNFQR